MVQKGKRPLKTWRLILTLLRHPNIGICWTERNLKCVFVNHICFLLSFIPLLINRNVVGKSKCLSAHISCNTVHLLQLKKLKNCALCKNSYFVKVPRVCYVYWNECDRDFYCILHFTTVLLQSYMFRVTGRWTVRSIWRRYI